MARNDCLKETMENCGHGGYEDMGYSSYQGCLEVEADSQCNIDVSG